MGGGHAYYILMYLHSLSSGISGGLSKHGVTITAGAFSTRGTWSG